MLQERGRQGVDADLISWRSMDKKEDTHTNGIAGQVISDFLIMEACG